MLNALTIDLWNTLIYEPPGVDRTGIRLDWMQGALNEMGRVIERAALEAAHAQTGDHLNAVQAGGHDLAAEEQVAHFLAAVDDAFVHDDAFTNLERQRLVQLYGDPALTLVPLLMERAAEALSELRAMGLRLALISNTQRTPGRVLRQILGDYDLVPLFDALIFSDEVGLAKPNPAIFHLALERLGATPATTLHIGDDLVLDLQGAHAAGMNACIVRLERPPELTPADRWVPYFKDVPAVVRGLL
jgi:putative hydrolase of the HAD superfamily